MRELSSYLPLVLTFFCQLAVARKCPANHHGLTPGLTTSPAQQDKSASNSTTPTTGASHSYNGCFPSLGFKVPSSVPSSTEGWWCDPKTEYAFLGFSYSVAPCQSQSQMKKEFANIKNTFSGRYIRLYGACDRKGFYNDVVEAAWEAGVGVHALIWFGFDGTDIYKSRRDTLLSAMHSNPKAKFVTRYLQYGSEPLFDHAIDVNTLASQVKSAKSNLASLGIPVTVSDMAYGFQINGGGKPVLSAIDSVHAHTLPFFSSKASTGAAAWPLVKTDIDWFLQNAPGKKIYLSENGWPSTTYSGVEANSAAAVANVQNERDYYNLLDSKCSYFKTVANGGAGWFAHIYSDGQAPGYGILGDNGAPKFAFKPKTSC